MEDGSAVLTLSLNPRPWEPEESPPFVQRRWRVGRHPGRGRVVAARYGVVFDVKVFGLVY